jgi:hypothetical protein
MVQVSERCVEEAGAEGNEGESMGVAERSRSLANSERLLKG